MSANKYSNLPDIVCIFIPPSLPTIINTFNTQDSSGKDIYETEETFQSIKDEVCIF